MKAMIFAAGLGTRLGTITQDKPKALVEVGGEPMLKRVILKFKDAGVREIVVNVHHYADLIINYLNANNNFGLDISVSDERDCLLDTGGGLLKARHLLDNGDNEPIAVHNADILTDFDIVKMLDAHNQANAVATLLVAERKTSRYLLFDRDNRMVGWKNMNSGEIRSPYPEYLLADSTALAFGGIHIVRPTIFSYLEQYSNEKKFSITPFYTDLCDKIRINAYLPPETYNWIDIGKPESLREAENIVSKLRPTRKAE